VEIDRFVQLRRVPINTSEAQQIARDLLKEINGLGPLDDLMQDQDVEDILINGYQNVFISRRGCCTNRPWPSVTTSICCALCSACWPWGGVWTNRRPWWMPACRAAGA
jgi:hypothetical protein